MQEINNFKNLLDNSKSGISKKTVNKIINAWYEAKKSFPKIGKDIPVEDRDLLKNQINACIKKEGGDISRQAKVVNLAVIYLNSSEEGKKQFLDIISCEFGVDTKKLQEKISNLSKFNDDTPEKINAEVEFSKALIPPRIKFLRQLAELPNGFIFLKDMRKDLLKFKKEMPSLKKLDNDLKSILKQYFNVNILKLKEITWDSPASMLERLAKYEAVHEIKSWKHLKHRLKTYHKMFGFFHPLMPNDPLIFVEVALVKGLANNIQKLIKLEYDNENSNNPDTAIFYSISSTQKGLRGISFGNLLIKRVVKKFKTEYPNIKYFSSLSPIPLFSSWLNKYLEEDNPNFCSPQEAKLLQKISKIQNTNKAILSLLQTDDWHTNKTIEESLKTPLMKLCVHYLSKVKRSNKMNAFDPVANFHLSNGAVIRQLNWLGDISPKGIKQSCGLMVNYKYKLSKIVDFHEAYLSSGTIHIAENILKV